MMSCDSQKEPGLKVVSITLMLHAWLKQVDAQAALLLVAAVYAGSEAVSDKLASETVGAVGSHLRLLRAYSPFTIETSFTLTSRGN